jgi:hypothetical protein
MFVAENKAGRLIATRLISPLTADEIDECITLIRRMVLSHRSVVFCVDLQHMPVLAPDAADKFLVMMRQDNPRVERTGYLMSSRLTTTALQMERLIREANKPVRRIFYAPGPLKTYLGEVLTPAEAARLEAFLNEVTRGPGA